MKPNSSRLIWEGAIEDRPGNYYQVRLIDGLLTMREWGEMDEDWCPIYSDHVRIQVLNKVILFLLETEG